MLLTAVLSWDCIRWSDPSNMATPQGGKAFDYEDVAADIHLKLHMGAHLLVIRSFRRFS